MKHEAASCLDEIAVREIAVEAGVDPRSVRKALRGGHVRGLAGDRIRRALEARKLRLAQRR